MWRPWKQFRTPLLYSSEYDSNKSIMKNMRYGIVEAQRIQRGNTTFFSIELYEIFEIGRKNQVWSTYSVTKGSKCHSVQRGCNEIVCMKGEWNIGVEVWYFSCIKPESHFRACTQQKLSPFRLVWHLRNTLSWPLPGSFEQIIALPEFTLLTLHGLCGSLNWLEKSCMDYRSHTRLKKLARSPSDLISGRGCLSLRRVFSNQSRQGFRLQ